VDVLSAWDAEDEAERQAQEPQPTRKPSAASFSTPRRNATSQTSATTTVASAAWISLKRSKPLLESVIHASGGRVG